MPTLKLDWVRIRDTREGNLIYTLKDGSEVVVTKEELRAELAPTNEKGA